jgi:hypothetical protein
MQLVSSRYRDGCLKLANIMLQLLLQSKARERLFISQVRRIQVKRLTRIKRNEKKHDDGSATDGYSRSFGTDEEWWYLAGDAAAD